MDQPAQKSELPDSSSFLMDGFVSLVTDPSTKQPIKIWRDSGAFQSLILQDRLPFSDQSKLGSSVLVQGFGGEKLLKERWLAKQSPSTNLLDFVIFGQS